MGGNDNIYQEVNTGCLFLKVINHSFLPGISPGPGHVRNESFLAPVASQPCEQKNSEQKSSSRISF